MQARIETDSLGAVEVPADRYWGAQTQRSLENFPIGYHRFPREVIRAFGIVKKAAAITNAELGLLRPELKDLIVRACDEVIDGALDDHFPLVVWQTGSGTQSNMNANEVIANRAIELAGGRLGSKSPVHPNDHVNRSQSSNDTFPTVMHVAAVSAIRTRLLPPLDRLCATIEDKAAAFSDVVKLGRTHLMDAVPLSLGDEFSAYAASLRFAAQEITRSLDGLYRLAQGGTAVGTGLNSHPGFADRVAACIAALTGEPFVSAANKFMAIAAHEAIVNASGAVRLLATTCTKIANDVRLLASGPRGGLAELSLPANEPGSSIMPGKVNPTQCEALIMAAAQAIGNDLVVATAGSGGQLELNACKPVMIHNLLESVGLLGDALASFDRRCMAGIEPNRDAIARHLDNSLMLVTALNPVVGYDNAARIVRTAFSENLTLREAAMKLGLLSAEDFDAHVNPKRMLRP